MIIRELIEELQKADDLDSTVIVYDDEHNKKLNIATIEFSFFIESKKEVAIIKV